MNKYVRYSLLALGLTLGLAACSKDEPTTPTPQGQEVVSVPVTLDLESKFLPIKSGDENSSARAVLNDRRNDIAGNNTDFTNGYDPKYHSKVILSVKDASGKYILDDEGQRTGTLNQIANIDQQLTIQQQNEIEMLLIMRAPSTKDDAKVQDELTNNSQRGVSMEYSYYVAKWKYDATHGTYRMYGVFNVNTYSRGDEIQDILAKKAYLEVMLIAGGWNYDQTNHTLTLGFTRAVDLKKGSTDISVPYVSDWVRVVRDSKGTFAPQSPIRLKPYGSLLTFTFRNNSSQPVRFKQLYCAANQMAFIGKATLTRTAFNGTSDPQREELPVTYQDGSGGSFRASTINGIKMSTFYHSQTDLSAGSYRPSADGLTVKNDGKLADYAVVTWFMPQKLSQTAGFSETTSSGLTPKIGGPQFHVYAADAVNANTGDFIRKPNYAVVPIMGTDKTFEAGKTYTINCEFYDQPNQPLGYLSAGYVAADGASFNNTWESNSQIPMVQLKNASAFIDGKTINGATYYMGDEAWANLISLAEPINFTGKTDQVRYGSATGIPGTFYVTNRENYLPVPSTSGKFTAGTFDQMVAVTSTPNSSNENVAVGLAYRRKNAAGRSIRSPYQAIMLYKGTSLKGTGELASNDYLSSLEVRSYYVGKYFVGNVYETPVMPGHRWSWAEGPENRGPIGTWGNGDLLQGGVVTRRFGSAGTYSGIDDNDLNQNNAIPSNTSRVMVGNHGFYWFYDTNSANTGRDWIKLLLASRGDNSQYGNLLDLYRDYLGADESYYRAMYGYNGWNGGIFHVSMEGSPATGPDRRNRGKVFFYQMLRPYSNTYQGDLNFVGK